MREPWGHCAKCSYTRIAQAASVALWAGDQAKSPATGLFTKRPSESAAVVVGLSRGPAAGAVVEAAAVVGAAVEAVGPQPAVEEAAAPQVAAVEVAGAAGRNVGRWG